MGFFSGLFGGGSKTNVQQTSKNYTTVDVSNQIANVIDLESIAMAFTHIGELFDQTMKDSTEKTQALFSGLLAQMGLNQQAAILTAAADAQAQNEQNAVLNRGLNMLKIAGLCFAVYFVWRKLL